MSLLASYFESTEDSWSVLSFECSLDLSICLLAMECLAGAMLHYTTDEVPATYVESTEDSWSVLSFECSLDLSICLLAMECLAGAMLHYTTDELSACKKSGRIRDGFKYAAEPEGNGARGLRA